MEEEPAETEFPAPLGAEDPGIQGAPPSRGSPGTGRHMARSQGQRPEDVQG